MGDALTWQARHSGSATWQPQWLGASGRRLYAGLHLPVAPLARIGVVLVPPLLHEQPRSRRLLAEIATELAACGLPALRFEFFGTGDSDGEGEQADIESMGADLDLAVAALRDAAGVERVVPIAWRGGALPLLHWLRAGGTAPLRVLWEPVLDGAALLAQWQRDDAGERASRARYRLGAPTLADDGQLMGVGVSARLRAQVAGLHADAADAHPGTRVWGVLRAGQPPAGLACERVFELPADSPTFDGSTRMDSGLFVTPQLKRIAQALGHALVQDA